MSDWKKVRKYWPQYKVSNIWAMVKNSFKQPKSCNENFNGLVVITGATSGIGYNTARKYASYGAKLILINRSLQKSEILSKELQRDFGVQCSYIIADLSRIDEMHRVGKSLLELDEPIDVLIHNAGTYLKKRTLTPDGIETTFAVNYLAPFVITYLIKDKMKSQSNGRIIFVSSEGYRFAVWGLKLDDLNFENRRYSGLEAYGSSKLAQILSMMIFKDYFEGTGVTVNAMHPGMVRTATGRDNGAIYLWFKRNFIDRVSKSSQISADALYYLGTSKEVESVSGKFFNLTTEEGLAPPALDREEALKLWEVSLKEGRLI
ncbi:MAG: SDR family NAD(P)-dependent oxidoreductase [Caldisericaceae bacterium]